MQHTGGWWWDPKLGIWAAAESGHWRQILLACKDSRLQDTGSGVILRCAQRPRASSTHTSMTENCYFYLGPQTCICGADERVKALEKCSRISSHKLPGAKSSPGILVVQKQANGDKNMTMLSRIPPEETHLCLSTFRALTTVCLKVLFCVCLPSHLRVPGRQGTLTSIFGH